MIKIMIVDDHLIYRDGLRVAFKDKKDLKIMAEAENGKIALQKLDTVEIDIVLLDIRMPVLDGIATLGRIKSQFPKVKVIILTGYEDVNVFSKAMSLKTDGFILKSATAQIIFQTIHDVMEGKVIVSPKLLRNTTDYRNLRYELTDEDLDVLTRIAKGERTSKIAGDLHFGERTIKSHLTNIYEKLGVNSRVAAVAKVMQLGLIKL
ncbi:response regulator transcription factor [Pediococcus damnosus]|uniref:response regulator transcription factor n=1 Tax=Pediococcus damnosus TaxID=51663 RepID=UPI000C1FAB0B|nr:response regulator transcription factor [Pediococcus damnosus]PJE49064.1 hypothetical protein BSQ36_03510 [Pediococcus damnosus]